MPKHVEEHTESVMISGQVAKASRRSTNAVVQTTLTKTLTVQSVKKKNVKERKKGGSSSNDLEALSPELHATVAAQLASLEKDTMEQSWYNSLHAEFEKSYFRKLKEFLETEMKANTVFPSLNNIYSWSRYTPLNSVKIVILGQDPYHNVGQAHGLSFSVLPPTKIPASLRNIYKQIATDIPSFVIPKTEGDLSRLAKLGVLWLNTSLTVRAHQAGSHHGKGWETFTAQVLKTVVSRPDSNGVVFMAWGLPASKTCNNIGIDETKHLVLKSAHPSPLSAHRGFLGNGHFKRANEWLKEKYGEGAEIDWTVLNRPEEK
ncbi:uracil DNA glycosylase [Paramarasmius palmivorus]|uniref:Uracil-DNA glycosylase n=1 Tax=Paramarasmius palmivorus TaxID=297713 RepID=A0AAW0DDG2_9AGAR